MFNVSEMFAAAPNGGAAHEVLRNIYKELQAKNGGDFWIDEEQDFFPNSCSISWHLACQLENNERTIALVDEIMAGRARHTDTQHGAGFRYDISQLLHREFVG